MIISGPVHPHEQELEEVRQARREESDFRKNQKATNRWLVRLGLVGLFVSAVGFFVQAYQLHLTRLAVDASVRQAKAAETANATTKESIQLSQDSFAFTKQQAEQSAESSKEEHVRAEQSRVLDLRPWVGLVGLNPNPMEADKPLTAAVDLMNTGKTMARNFACKSGILVQPAPFNIETVLRSEAWQKIKTNRSVVFPGMHTGLALSTVNLLEKDRLEKIKDGRMIAFVIGDCRYDDTVGHDFHRTEFCSQYDSRRNVFIGCSTHNAAN